MLNLPFKKLSEYIPLTKLTASLELEVELELGTKNKLCIKDKPFSITSRSLRKLAAVLFATATFDNKFLRKSIFVGSVKSLLRVRLEDPELELELESW